jgi:hypothetical protein
MEYRPIGSGTWIRAGRFPRKVGADGRTVLGGNEPRGERGWKFGEGGGELEEWETSKFFEKGRIGLGSEVVWGLMKVENNPEKRKFGLTDGVHCEEGMVESSEGGSCDKQDRQGKFFCPLADTDGSI